jgi:hypothetical protein
MLFVFGYSKFILIMKYIYLFGLIIIANTTNAQFSGSASYNLSVPQKEMAENINPIHALYLGGEYKLPGSLNNISVGLTTGLGTYANLTKETTFSFGNNNPTTTDVHYTSNVFSSSANIKIDITKHFLITPFAKIEGGFQKFYSTIRIDNPNDLDGCKPLERRSILKDATAFYGVGGGLKIDMNIFGDKFEKDEKFIEVSVSTIRGGKLDYINTRELKDAQDMEDEPMPEKGRPLNLKFINVNSNIIHEHKVAQVYTSQLRLFDIRVSYRMSF